MDDYLDKLAELSDQIVGSSFEKAAELQAELDDLTENPPPPPEIEPPKEAPPQIEPPKEEEPLVQPLPDPLADIRGMTAKQIDKKMNKKQMIDLVEQATGERRPQRTKAADLAAELEQLAR